MRKSVIDIHGQTTKALSQGNCKTLVVGISKRAPGGQRTVLVLHEPRGETVAEQCAVYIRFRVGPVITPKEREGVVAGLPPALHPVEQLRRRPGWIKAGCNSISLTIFLNDRVSVHNADKICREKIVEERDGRDLAGVHVLLALPFQDRSCRVPIHPALGITNVIEDSGIPAEN